MDQSLNNCHRRSIRLPAYDYSGEGAYYITICTQDRKCIFGKIANGQMQLNPWGRIADTCWREIPDHFPNAALGEYMIMPNHLHGIIVIVDRPEFAGARHGVGTRHAVSLRMFGKPMPGSVSTIIGSFKSAVSKRINIARGKNKPPIWQGRFYEHIIRNDNSYETIRQYILENTLHWAQDDENPERKPPIVRGQTHVNQGFPS